MLSNIKTQIRVYPCGRTWRLQTTIQDTSNEGINNAETFDEGVDFYSKAQAVRYARDLTEGYRAFSDGKGLVLDVLL
jgi:hypothetical protein